MINIPASFDKQGAQKGSRVEDIFDSGEQNYLIKELFVFAWKRMTSSDATDHPDDSDQCIGSYDSGVWEPTEEGLLPAFHSGLAEHGSCPARIEP